MRLSRVRHWPGQGFEVLTASSVSASSPSSSSALGCGNVLFLLAPDLLAECCSQLRLESHHCRVPFAREAIRIRSEPRERDAGADGTPAPATAVNLLRRSASA